MRFEPNLIPDDEPDGEGGDVQLPAELAALAQQLTDDAAHLSRVYPASRAEVALPAGLAAAPPGLAAPGKGRRRGRPLVMGIGTTAVAAAIVLVVALVDWPFASNRGGGKSGDATAALDGGDSIAARGSGVSVRDDNDAASRTDAEAGLLAASPSTRTEAALEWTPDMGEEFPASAYEGFERSKDLSPVLLLREVTGPELEALFDLLEGEPTESTSVSI